MKMIFDSDGYPPDSDLYSIEKWPYNKPHELMEFISDAWMAYGSVRKKEKTISRFRGESFSKDDSYSQYYLLTGGWSGNEDIIGAMRRNEMFWGLYWESSNRGGLHVFRVPLRELTIHEEQP